MRAINSVRILRFLWALFLSGFCSCVYAGADPAPTDWLPQFTKINVDGGDIVFDAGISQLRLSNGQLGDALSPPNK